MNHSSQLLSQCFLILAACASAPAFSACGARSMSDGSTDTGNPPVIDEQAITVTEDGPNVIVRGAAGAVTDDAEVTVTNLKSGAKKKTTAKADGSFQLELPGSAADKYEVEAVVDGQRTRLNIEPVAPPADEEPASGGFDLVDRSYLLQMAEGDTPLKDATVSLSFGASGEFGFSAGCNGHGGSYSICEGDKLCAEGFLSTLIDCYPEGNDPEDWLAAFFKSKPTLEQSGDWLTVIGADASLEFLEEMAEPDRPLLGSQWTVDTLIMGETASNFSSQFARTIMFNADSTVTVYIACNKGEGTFKQAAGELTFSQVRFLPLPCADMASASAEASMQALLADGVTTFEIDGNRLTLMRGGNGIAATTD